MDVGWLKTYDQYYDSEVRLIFNSVFKKLKEDERYTYTLGDIGFFRRYYQSLQQDKDRDAIKSLVERG